MAIQKNKNGFTVVEVTLFLAITALMIVGLLTGINVRVAAQRYNDSVQDVDDFLTKAYSEVINVENSRESVAFNQNYCNGYLQNIALQKNVSINEVITANGTTHAGRSRCAIYGKLVTFGEQNGKMNAYTVIGRLETSDLEDKVVTNEANSSTLNSLYLVGADIYAYNSSGSNCFVEPAGVFESHNFIWDSSIEKPGSNEQFKGALLIVRSPLSGTIHTYRLKDGETINMAQYFSTGAFGGCNKAQIESKTNQITNSKDSLMYHLSNGNFIAADLDICVNSPDVYAVGGRKRNIRVLADGRNASAVKLVDVDTPGENRCAS